MTSVSSFLFSSFIIANLLSLTACMNVATTGAQVVYNRQNLQKNVNDQIITMRSFQALNYKTTAFKNANIVIATFNREVLLAGQSPTVQQKEQAEEIVKAIPNVKQVYNLVEIASPTSTLTRISDAWITAKVKAQLLAGDKVDVAQVKVVTENGRVYLMGILEPEAANEAVDIARNTEGVLSVTKIFSYISISKVLNKPADEYPRDLT